MKTAMIALMLALNCVPAYANFGYCFTQGLMGGTKAFIHDTVREADFWDGAIVNAYRAELENAHRFRFGALSCPGFDTEVEARANFATMRAVHLQRGFAEFLYPIRTAEPN